MAEQDSNDQALSYSILLIFRLVPLPEDCPLEESNLP